MTIETTFQTYGSHIEESKRAGNFLMWSEITEDESAMLIVPVTYCPNVAELLDTSNWECMLACLRAVDPEERDFDICRFGHWATPYEFVIVRPNSPAHVEAERIAAALADYPVLSDEDFSEREWNAFNEDLESEIDRLTIVVNGTDISENAHMRDTLIGTVGRAITENESKDNCQSSDVEDALRDDLGFEYDEDEFTWSGNLTIEA